jgi:hypothetical protein
MEAIAPTAHIHIKFSLLTFTCNQGSEGVVLEATGETDFARGALSGGVTTIEGGVGIVI